MSIVASSRSARRCEVFPTLIEWNRPGEDLWIGRIQLDYAGMVELIGDEYVVRDWQDERIAAFDSLESAQLSLEPAARVSALEAAQRRAERIQWIASSSLTLLIVTAAALGGWLLTVS